MESFLPESIQLFLGAAIATAFVLNRLARYFTHISWLQWFRLPELKLSDVEKSRRKRSGNLRAGIEIVGLGLIIPVFYFGLSLIFFNTPETFDTVIVMAISIAFIILGVFVFVRTFKSAPHL